MKLLFENWRKFIDEQLLAESRYTDAHDFAQNIKKMAQRAKLTDLYNRMSEEDISKLKSAMQYAINYLSEADPTGNNKYTMWAARNLRATLARRLQVLLGGVVQNWDKPREGDKTNAEHYANLVRQDAAKLSSVLKRYHKLKERNLIKRDLQSYDPTKRDEWMELYNDVVKVEQDVKQREEKERLAQSAKAESDFIDTASGDFSIVRPNTTEASCYFGYGTRWCISATKARNYFNEYTAKGTAFYFVTFKYLTNEDPNKKLALVFAADDAEDPSEVFDAEDDDVGVGGLEEAIQNNLITKALKQMPEVKETLDPIKDPDEKAAKLRELATFSRQNIVSSGERFRDWRFTWEIAEVLFDNSDLSHSLADIKKEEDKEEQWDMIRDTFYELASLHYSEIVYSSQQHLVDNPAGPSDEDFQRVLDQYEFSYIYASFDEYDVGKYYWDAGGSFEFENVELGEDIDGDQIASIVQQKMDDNHVYPDEVEWDEYDNRVTVRFTPDHDESEGPDGFERFLERISEYDQAWETITTESEEEIVRSGLTIGGLRTIMDQFEKLNLERFEVEIEGREISVATRLNPKVVVPKNINAVSREKVALLEYLYERGMETDEHSTPFIKAVEGSIESTLEAYSRQLILPGMEPEEKPSLAVPKFNVSLHPADNFKNYLKQQYQWEKINPVELPYWLDIRLNETNITEDEELKVAQAFVKWVDQEKIFNQLHELLANILAKDVQRYVKSKEHASAEIEAAAFGESKNRVAGKKIRIIIGESKRKRK